MSSPTIPALSVVVMTYNEEVNLPVCLKSVEGIGEEIFILDSFSTDKTLEIAKSFGARVEQHAFGSYVEQKKRLVEKAKYDWVFCIDADEYLSDQLRNSILVGFGIKDKQTFDAACRYANGAIIGSAFVKALDGSKNEEQSVKQFLKSVI